jgi:hypothetical protein
MTVERQRLSDHIEIALKMSLPKHMAQNDHWRRTKSEILRQEGPAEL